MEHRICAIVVTFRARGFTHAVFLDQDSVPCSDMIERLMAATLELAGKGVRVAAVGPRYLDPRSGRVSYAARFGCLGFRRVNCPKIARNEPIPAVS